MTVTDNYGWPLPTEDSSTEIWDLIQQLGEGVDASLFALLNAPLLEYTPQWLNGLGGIPLTQGAGSSMEGRYRHIGPLTWAMVSFQRGPNTHVGDTYHVYSLPVPGKELRWVTGWGSVSGQNTIATTFPVTPVGLGGTSVALALPSGQRVSHANPSWNANGWVRFQALYERA